MFTIAYLEVGELFFWTLPHNNFRAVLKVYLQIHYFCHIITIFRKHFYTHKYNHLCLMHFMSLKNTEKAANFFNTWIQNFLSRVAYWLRIFVAATNGRPALRRSTHCRFSPKQYENFRNISKFTFAHTIDQILSFKMVRVVGRYSIIIFYSDKRMQNRIVSELGRYL